MTASYVIPFSEIDKASLSEVGGKGANLGEMLKAGFPVPNGMCISTTAYQVFVASSLKMPNFFNELQSLQAGDLARVQEFGSRIREHLETLPIPSEIQKDIEDAWLRTGKDKFYAVRSSATAEDLPSASFAGQQDTYLNIHGFDDILDAVRRCWASLFTDRAIIYRARNQFDHQEVLLSVVIQEMVIPSVSGIMFTADPVSGNRKVITIDASYGLGEAIVSGSVTADMYQVRGEKIIKKIIGSKKLAIYSLPHGGTVTKELSEEEQNSQALSDNFILDLAAFGSRIEAHYGCEQDIEWCLTAENEIYVVQSRPITTLHPLVDPLTDNDGLHVYISFGHGQMMTRAITPLGRSVLRTVVPVGHSEPGDESTWAVTAASHLYIDLTNMLRVPALGKNFPKFAVNIDERISLGLEEVVGRPDFQKIPPAKGLKFKILCFAVPMAWGVFLNLFIRNPKLARDQADTLMEGLVARYERQINEDHGAVRIRHVQVLLSHLLPRFFPKLAQYVASGVLAMKLAEKYSKKWLGDSDEIAIMNKSLPGNVTTEMGLRVGDLGDIVRERPAVLEYLTSSKNKESFRKGLQDINGGEEFLDEFDSFLVQYGARCPGEIDISNERWGESPMSLISSILAVAKNSQAVGDHRHKHIQANEEAEEAARRIVERVRNTPWGYFKSILMKRLVTVFRYRAGMREHPKFTLIRILYKAKQVILEEATELVNAGKLESAQDVFYLGLSELHSLLSNTFDGDVNLLIKQREIVNGTRKASNAPEGAIIGSGVSAGVVEGFARVVLSPDTSELEDGEIMVAPFTDPGWTPLFNSAKALVIVVGGMLTHGAVVAREYGIPAVVGVDNATEIIKTGQYIRVNGNEGYIEILSTPE
ncbi:hypothetical protein NQZ79_g2375 [Umbelopsis isabellina]|nr:hypothetical protein NQZ79_g2375 [Umbelopsis isabellina]